MKLPETIRRNRIALIPLVLFLGLVSILVLLTWREVKHDHVNHALIAAVDRHDTSQVRALLREGAEPNTPILPDDKRSAWTRLLDRLLGRWMATSHETHSLLLKAVAWPPQRDHNPLEPPTVDNADMALALVESGATVNFDGNGYEYESEMTFLDHYKLSVRGFTGWHTTPLLAAAGLQQWKTVKLLLAHHADVNAADTFGNTALMYAAAFDNAETVDALLNGGADVNARNHGGETALVYALDAYPYLSDWRPMPELRATVKRLLRHGASVTGRDSTGMTVLQAAFVYGKNDKLLLRMLKHAGARK